MQGIDDTNDPQGVQRPGEHGSSDEARLLDDEVRGDDLALLSEVDPAGLVDDVTLVRVRSMIDERLTGAQPAVSTSMPSRWRRSLQDLAHLPALRPVAAVLVAGVMFSSGVLAAPAFDTTEDGPAFSGTRNSTVTGAPESSAAAMDTAKFAPWSGTRTVLTDGLTVDVSSQPVNGYTLVAETRDLSVLAATLGKVFGVNGAATATEWGSVQIGTGTTPTVSVYASSGQPASWSFNDPTNDPWQKCWSGNVEPRNTGATTDDATGEGTAGSVTGSSPSATSTTSPQTSPGVKTGTVSTMESDAAVTSVVPDMMPAPNCAAASTLPTDGVARTRATEILGALTPVMLEYEIYRDEQSVTVTGYPVFGGTRSNAATWGVSFSEDGIWNAYGSFVVTKSTAPYTIITAKAAISRANDVRFTAYPSYPNNFDFGSRAPMIVPAADTATGAAGAKVPWPVESVAVVSAKLGWSTVNSDSGVLIVPSWELKATDGRVWSVIAVVEEELDFTAVSPAYGVMPMGTVARDAVASATGDVPTRG